MELHALVYPVGWITDGFNKIQICLHLIWVISKDNGTNVETNFYKTNKIYGISRLFFFFAISIVV